jgi:RNA-directed DNA polymerase
MVDERQKIQLKLALEQWSEGEAPRSEIQGTEASMAKRANESLADGEQLMERMCGRENLKRALAQVKRNKGSAGVDRMSVGALPGYLKEHWPSIREQLLAARYEPRPVKRVEIDKREGGDKRKLGIPCVLDRFIQQALLQVLQPIFEPTFAESSYGFRPGRSAHQAVAQAQTYLARGYHWVVDLDLEKFFDRVNHDLLMGRVAKRVQDKRVLKLIRRYLEAGVMEHGSLSETEEGTPQGGPLSPCLSNILLTDLDRELEHRGHCFVRYADDCNVYVKSERAGLRVKASVTRFLATRLKLKVNEAKSAVAPPWHRKFLGFSFTWGKTLKRRIAPQALLRFKRRVRELSSRTQGRALREVVQRLAPYLRGWRGYFGFCETPSALRDLDRWIRRRLRSLVWKQWKRGRRRFAELVNRGVDRKLAAQTAGSAHGPWHLAVSPALHIALPNTLFGALGLPQLHVVPTA